MKLSRKLLPLGFVAITTAVGLSSGLSTKTLTVAKVIDGDTVVLSDDRHVRLIGVDTPEEDECYFKEAKEVTKKLLLNKKITLETDFNEIDQFGRTLGYVFLSSGKFVNEELLLLGTGEYFQDDLNPKYQDRLITAANEAHLRLAGRWSVCAPDPKVGCQIKGNLDKMDKRRYISTESRHYRDTVVNLENHDRWFCSEEEATIAGFIKARI